ncbi:Protein YLS9 [Carex littledalei]|uniref:Protein YLS9 n=1 Tax=Carex littledalei TaxID=544730 RepID=A0A833QN94_9POAL|nr:Protein YLS9 [Carex littledalei]
MEKKVFPGSSKPNRFLCSCILLLLILAGITALIVYLVYRPSKPHFSVARLSVFALKNNVSSQYPNLLCTSMQLTFVFNNPNDRVGVFYDRLTVYVYYHDEPITPPAPLPPIFQEPAGTVALSPVLGAPSVPVSGDTLTQLMADRAYGVVGLKVVVLGRVKFKSGPFKSGWSMLYVRCDLAVGLKKGGTGTAVPLLSEPKCQVEI